MKSRRNALLAFSISFISLVCGAQELLKNPGFENGITDWRHDGFYMQTDGRNVHQGVASVKCTGRTRTFHGPGQDIQVNRGGRYLFNSYIKLINDNPSKMFQMARVKIAFHHPDGKTTYFPVAKRPYLTASEGWVAVGGDFVAPDADWTSARLYVEGLDPAIDYYYDDATLTEIQPIAWEADANSRIDNLRKSNVHFVVKADSHFAASDLMIQIDHKKHSFGFGSMVRSDYMLDPDFTTYQNVVSYMFNWATIQDYKWRYNRGNRTHPDYSAAVNATDELRKRGLKVRGHCMFWAVDKNVPDWVRTLSGDEVKTAVEDHIRYMTGVTKGKLDHWDVNNELVHGHFFEQHTRDPNYTYKMFKQVHTADPKPLLCLNEYSVVSNGDATQAYLAQINEFKAAQVGLGMVGVQSHLHGEPDLTVIKRRLDTLAQAGLPIWITELDIANPDDKVKADWYESVLRMYFSHPSVQGITFWGFWDHDMDPEKALVHGYQYTLDEAGKRFLHLTREEWSTHVNQTLSSSGTQFDVRGFQGDYDVIVWYQGKSIKKSSFTLGPSDKTVTIGVHGDGHEINLPSEEDPFKTSSKPSVADVGHSYKLGSASSSSQSSSLQCVNRWSAESEIGDDKFVDATCEGDEVMTGCSSILKNHDWHRDGEKMIMSNGQPTCRAFNGFWSTAAVQAIARCCKLKALTCDYRTAGPSPTGVNDRVVTSCHHNSLAFGCSTWTWATESDGTYFNHTNCASQNDDAKTGVYSYAACCSGGNVQCQTQVSSPSGPEIGDVARVTCPGGSVMTGCNVYSLNGRAAGAFIATVHGVEACHGFNGFKKYGQEEGVRAMATCCHA